MIALERHGDVVRVRMSTWRTRGAGYDVSAYLIGGVLVDAGFRHVWPAFRKLVAELQPRGVIVTHWHEDHAGNAPTLAPVTPLWMADYTEQKLRERQQVKLYRHYTWGRPRALIGALDRLDPAPLRLVPTPGHSPDHHAVFDPATETLVSGDLWLGVKVRVMGETENPYQIVASLDRAIALRPERMFDAHRGLVTNPVLSLTAKRDWTAETVAEIERRLDAGQSERQILDEALDGEESIALFSQGEYSRRNFIRAVIRCRA